MDWPKQVRRGLTGLAMTSAAWVHAAHAEALPESQRHDITDYARRYESAVAQAEAMRGSDGKAPVSTVRARVEKPVAPVAVAVQKPVSPAAVVIHKAAPADAAIIAAANSATVKSMAVAAVPAAQPQPSASMVRPRLTATVTRSAFMPVGAQSSNPAYAEIQTNNARQEAAALAADQQRAYRAGSYLPATEAAEAYAHLGPRDNAATLADLRTAAGASATMAAKPAAAMDAFSARAQDSALLARGQAYQSPGTETHHQIALGALPVLPADSPETVALNKAQLRPAAAVSSGMHVSSMLPQAYRDAELAPPPAVNHAPVRMQPSAVAARAMRPVVAAPVMAAQSMAASQAAQNIAQPAPMNLTPVEQPAASVATAEPQLHELAELRPAAGGFHMGGGAIVPMMAAASAAKAEELLSLPARAETAGSLPSLAPLAVQANGQVPPLAVQANGQVSPLAAQARDDHAPLAAMPTGPVPTPVDGAAPPLPPEPVAAASVPAMPSAMPPLPPEAASAAPAPTPLPSIGAAPTPVATHNGPPTPVAPTLGAPTPVNGASSAAVAAAPAIEQAHAKPPIDVPVSPPAQPEPIPVTAKAPKTSPEKILAAQQKKLASEARAEKMQANKMPIQLERSRPLDDRLNNEGESKIQRVDGVGLSIAVRTPKIDAAYELGQAYEALMGGDSMLAASIYQRILDVQPRNVDALFGLATTYHRTGALEKAKPVYATLLAVAPDHRDGLNNFLMLLGEQNPAEALSRLQSLEAANRSYAPIPAQIAMIQERMGNMGEAVSAMTRAVSRAPENVQYRYNLAVLLDKAGNWQDAASIYQDVLAAVDRGEKVPSSRDDIQRRLTYLMTNHG